VPGPGGLGRSRRWCDPGYLTPDRYPVPAKCPKCGLVQMLIADMLKADGQHLRLHVHGDISDMPWEGECGIPRAGRVPPDRVEPDWVRVEAFYRMRMSPNAEGETPAPDCVWLWAVAYVMTARVTVEARWWHRLQTWAETASLADCRRCLDEATADGPGLRPTFAREFLLRLEQHYVEAGMFVHWCTGGLPGSAGVPRTRTCQHLLSAREAALLQ